MKNALHVRLASVAFAAVAVLSLTSCSTTEVKDVWTAPDLTNISFKKVMVIAATKDGATRRISEDALAAALPNVNCVPSYSLITDESNMTNVDKVSESLKTAGVDGVVVMRMISDRSEVNVTGNMGYPVGYRSFRGYYGNYAMMGFNTTTVTTDRIIEIETTIYEAPGGKLIWSGVTSSTSPGNIKQLVDEAVAAVRGQLVKQKLIPSS
jgi:hypothetical protein